MIALLTQDAASVSLNNAINTQSSVWAEIEEGAMHKAHEHKHKEHHHHHHEKEKEKKEELTPAQALA